MVRIATSATAASSFPTTPNVNEANLGARSLVETMADPETMLPLFNIEKTSVVSDLSQRRTRSWRIFEPNWNAKGKLCWTVWQGRGGVSRCLRALVDFASLVVGLSLSSNFLLRGRGNVNFACVASWTAVVFCWSFWAWTLGWGLFSAIFPCAGLWTCVFFFLKHVCHLNPFLRAGCLFLN